MGTTFHPPTPFPDPSCSPLAPLKSSTCSSPQYKTSCFSGSQKDSANGLKVAYSSPNHLPHFSFFIELFTKPIMSWGKCTVLNSVCRLDKNKVVINHHNTGDHDDVIWEIVALEILTQSTEPTEAAVLSYCASAAMDCSLIHLSWSCTATRKALLTKSAAELIISTPFKRNSTLLSFCFALQKIFAPSSSLYPSLPSSFPINFFLPLLAEDWEWNGYQMWFQSVPIAVVTNAEAALGLPESWAFGWLIGPEFLKPRFYRLGTLTVPQLQVMLLSAVMSLNLFPNSHSLWPVATPAAISRL